MNKTIMGRTHIRGRGRIYFGLGISGIAVFWLAQKVGWLGVGSSGLLWPLLALGLGVAIIAGGRLRTHRLRYREAVQLKGGRS